LLEQVQLVLPGRRVALDELDMTVCVEGVCQISGARATSVGYVG
jgi:hypothetical protein